MTARIVMKKKRHKYNAKRTERNGRMFASKKEAKRYDELKIMEEVGLISKLVLQPSFILYINGIVIGKYFADFSYYDNEKKQEVIEDVKGVRTPLYKFKKRYCEAQYDITITEI